MSYRHNFLVSCCLLNQIEYLGHLTEYRYCLHNIYEQTVQKTIYDIVVSPQSSTLACICAGYYPNPFCSSRAPDKRGY